MASAKIVVHILVKYFGKKPQNPISNLSKTKLGYLSTCSMNLKTRINNLIHQVKSLVPSMISWILTNALVFLSVIFESHIY